MFKLSSLLGLKGMAIAAGVALAAGFGAGVWVRDAFCDAAAAKLQVKSLRADLDVTRDQLNRASAHAANLAEADAINKDAIRDLESALQLPATSVCRLSDDHVRRLRNIK